MVSFDMRGTWLETLRRYVVLLAVASLLWEMAQLPLYTVWWQPSWFEIAWAVAHCSAGDVAIGSASMLAALLLVGRSEWPAVEPWRVALVATAIGVVYTLYSEWLNVEVRGSWAYTPVMPRLPVLGTGLGPVLQWLLLPPACFAAATRLASYRPAAAASPRPDQA
jgi:hypothetical protein